MNNLLKLYLGLTMSIGAFVGFTATTVISTMKSKSKFTKIVYITGMTCVSTIVFPIMFPKIIFDSITQRDSFIN